METVECGTTEVELIMIDESSIAGVYMRADPLDSTFMAVKTYYGDVMYVNPRHILHWEIVSPKQKGQV